MKFCLPHPFIHQAFQKDALMTNENDKNEAHFSSSYGLKNKQETLAHYSTWAESYDQEIGEENAYAQPARATEMLLRFINPGPQLILDAGCGSGLSGVALQQAGFTNIHGCDFSPEMLKKAKEKNCYANLFEADLNEGQTTINDATFDAITCVGVFSFGHVSPDACDDLLRILKPGGHLIIALNEKFWDKGDLADKIASLEENNKVILLAKE